MTETQAPLAGSGGLAVGDAPVPAPAVGETGLPDVERLSLGEMEPDEAGELIARLLEKPEPRACRQVYELLGALAWKQSAERRSGEPLRAWYELYRYASGLMRDAGEAEIGFKLLGVADQCLRWVRHGLGRSSEGVRRRAHEAAIVEFLYNRRLPVWREDLIEVFGFKGPNMTRVLANLATAGLIDRHLDGRRQSVALTAEGREAHLHRMRIGGLVTDPPIDRAARAAAA